MPGKTWRGGAVAALAVGLLAAVTPAASATGPAARIGVAADVPTSHNGRYVVRLDERVIGAAGAVTAAVRSAGGAVVSEQHALNTVVVSLPGGGAAALAAVPGVRAVSPDRQVETLSLGYDPNGQPGSSTSITRLTGAQAMWKSGWTGAGIDVAVLDTGVAPVPALKDPGKVAVGPDLSFESQDPDLRYLDTYGHGTHMASIIAGREGPKASGTQYAADAATNFYGMAPDARIVSVKVGDREGAVDVSQVIAGIDWIVQNRNRDGLNVRVLNISFGTGSKQSWQLDPLSWAAECAWRSGIAVVAAAGNDGASTAGLANPAYNPWLISVGAADTRGTDSMSDDVVPAFSARAATNSDRRVDLVAPGVGVVAGGVAGSKIYTSYPGARVGNGLVRGSGTSQAAAVVSGALALLMQQNPQWAQNDQFKKLLRDSAAPLAAGQSPLAYGAGELNLFAAARQTSITNAGQGLAAGNGRGSLDVARGGYYVSMDGVDLRGEVDIMGSRWDATAMANATGGFWTWWGGQFNGQIWAGDGWAADTTSWAGKTWSGKTWSGKTWSGKTWSGKTWSGKTWSNAVWTGTGWSSATWTGPVTPGAFSTRLWSSASWS